MLFRSPGLSTTVLVTVTDSEGAVKATISGETNPDGWFNSGNYAWDPQQPDLMPGDLVTATWPGGSRTITPIGDVSGEIDLANDVVTATLNANWFAPDTLTVFCAIGEEGAPSWEIPDVDPVAGTFLCDFGAMGWDLQARHTIVLGYYEPDGDQVMNAFMRSERAHV